MSADDKVAHVQDKVIRCHQKWSGDIDLGDNAVQWVMYKSFPLEVSWAAFTHPRGLRAQTTAPTRHQARHQARHGVLAEEGKTAKKKKKMLN